MLRLVAVLALVSAVAHADPATVQLKNVVAPGEKPSLTVTANQPLKAVRLEVVRENDGRRFQNSAGRLMPGESATLKMGDGKDGHFRWKGTLVFELFDGGRFTSQLTFESGSQEPSSLKIAWRRDKLDLERRAIEIQLSRPAARVEVRVVGDDGSELGKGAADFHGAAPGTWLRIPWTQNTSTASVLSIELKASDTDGSSATAKLIPWTLRIPHEEVTFETGKWDVRPTEVSKLDKSYERIVETIERVRRFEPSVPIRVYVAGHTDTVGNPDDNRKLSLNRAKAIASYFRDHGLPLPVLYAGFGEDALKVKTADNTDEAANRRADYIVGAEEPTLGGRSKFVELR